MRRRRWSSEEDTVLIEFYESEGKLVSKRLPDRTPNACAHRAVNYLGLRSFRKATDHKWTDAEIKVLRDRYPDEGPTDELASVFGVSRVALGAKARNIGLRKLLMSRDVFLERRREYHLRKRSDPEYRKARRDEDKRRRDKNVAAGLCRCGRKRFFSSSSCKIHWAVSIGSTAGDSSIRFAKLILDLLNDQGFKCVITGMDLVPGKNASLDHVNAKTNGGDNSRENLQWLDLRVNRAKGDMSESEFVSMCEMVVCGRR